MDLPADLRLSPGSLCDNDKSPPEHIVYYRARLWVLCSDLVAWTKVNRPRCVTTKPPETKGFEVRLTIKNQDAQKDTGERRWLITKSL
jgi:hypothetical protein